MNPMTKLLRRSPLARRRRGGSLLEAALVFPVLTYLSFGMVEFGEYMYARHVFASAARDGCRQAILASTSQSNLTTAVSNTMSSSGFGSCGYTLAVTNGQTGATISDVSTVAAGTWLKVSVTVNFGNLGVRPLGVISSTKQVSGVCTMVKE